MSRDIAERVLSKIGEVLYDILITNIRKDVLDEGISKSGRNWQLHGSRKPHDEPDGLSYIYDVTKYTTDVEFRYVPICTKTFLSSETLCKLSARY